MHARAMGACHSAHIRRFLDAEGMVEVVEDLRRLLPGANPGQVLCNDPSWLLRCGTASRQRVALLFVRKWGRYCASAHPGCSGAALHH